MTKREKYPWDECYIPEPNSGCWLWLMNMDRRGYGRTWYKGRKQNAHRVFYELHIGPIPAGLHIDHKCRNRACVNPAHLEPVTLAENNRRGAVYRITKACKRGHLWAEQEAYYSADGKRRCRICATQNAEQRRRELDLPTRPQRIGESHKRKYQAPDIAMKESLKLAEPR